MKYTTAHHRAQRTILGAGLIALDVVLRDPVSPAAAIYAGGTCGNVLSILSFLGWNASAIGFVGGDLAGARVLADLQQCGVDCARLIASEKASTPVFLQQVREENLGVPRHAFLRECPACGEVLSHDRGHELPPLDVMHSHQPDVIFIDRLSSDIVALARAGAAREALVVYEPSVRADQAHWRDAMELVDVIKYSADRHRPEEFDFAMPAAARPIWEVQTAGERGLRFRCRQGLATSPWVSLDAVPAARVVDTCGAGDWCTAGLLHGLSWREDSLRQALDETSIRAALRMGQKLAAWDCAFPGARGGMYDAAPTISALIDDPQMTEIVSQGTIVGQTMESLCGRASCHPSSKSWHG